MKMQFRLFRAQHNGLRFEIEEDLPRVGAYLYRYEGEETTHDYLQDSIEDCKEFALEEFGVPLDSWVFLKMLDSQTDIPFVDNYLS
ncbi:hypothetical protein [uncultured Hymenobacter sp.]|uniref:hypothetical protein n=1 Tax=uncultured Hymenobacter sp. TaxID=170016 RepID=UPI0035C9F643